MKNITVSVPDDVYRAARVHAAENDTSVSALVAEYLRSFGRPVDDEEFERLYRMQMELIAEIPAGFSARDNMTRDELHDRALQRELHERALHRH